LVVRAALAVPEPASAEISAVAKRLGGLLSTQARSMSQTDILYQLAYDLARSPLAKLTPAEQHELNPVQLHHWSNGRASGASNRPLPAPLWAFHDGHLAGHTAGGAGSIVFNRPLTGEFEVSFDSYSSGESRSGIGYGGIEHAPSYAGGPVVIS